MKRFRGSILIMAALAAGALAGCGSTAGTGTASSVAGPTTVAGSSSSSGSSGATETGSAGSSSTAAADLSVAQSSLGQIVVDARGMTVYFFMKDVADSGKSNCSGSCLSLWPPVVAKGDTPSVSGVTGKIGTITTADGTKQVTINGLPVYTYAKDSAAGDVKGQEVGGVWYAVSPSGSKMEGMPTTSGSGY